MSNSDVHISSKIKLDGILRGKRMPAGIELEWMSDEPIETGRLASDFAYVDGRWLDLDHWRYWIGGRRPRNRMDLVAPEAIVRIKDVLVSPTNSIVTRNGATVHSRLFGSPVQSGTISGEDILGDYSGEHGTALLTRKNYGHWILQRLPRILTLNEWNPELPFLNAQWGDTGLLSRIGITEDSVERFPKSTLQQYVHVDELLVPTHLARPGLERVMDANRMERVARKFTAGITPDPTLPALLYVARKPTDGRPGASNKDEFQDYMESLGFTTWYPIDHPIETQIQYFQAAKVVVAEIGSQGLTSMFVDSDKTVIIITPAKSKGFGPQRSFAPKWRQWQRVTCEARGQHYAQIVVADDAAYRNFEIDIQTVARALETYPNRVW